MGENIYIANAGNVLPSALAVLKKMGFTVLLVKGKETAARLLEASKPGCRVRAEDPVVLLGLIKLVEERGSKWEPTDSEVDELIQWEEQSHD